MLAGNSSFTTAPPPLPAVVAPGHREGHMGSQSLFVQSDISSGVDFPFQPLVPVTLLTSTVPSLGAFLRSNPLAFWAESFSSNHFSESAGSRSHIHHIALGPQENH